MAVRPDDFRRMTPREFAATLKAWNGVQDEYAQRDWEIARTVAAILIAPHSRKPITPKALLPLWFDKPTSKRHTAPAETEGIDQKKRMEDIKNRLM